MGTTLRALGALRSTPPPQQPAQPQPQAESTGQQAQVEGSAVGTVAVSQPAEAVEQLRRQASSDTIGSITEESMLSKLLQSEITDQWRVFEMMEPFLQTPLLFANSFRSEEHTSELPS